MDKLNRMRTTIEEIKKHFGKFIWTLAGLAALYIVWTLTLGCAECDWTGTMWIAIAIFSSVIAGHFVYSFTRDLPSSKRHARLGRELRTIFVYAYALQGLAMGTGLLLLIGVVPAVPVGKLGGLVYGCQESERGYGSDLAACTDQDSVGQWLLHIGSRAQGPFENELGNNLLHQVDQACDHHVDAPMITEAISKFDTSVGQGVVSAVATACGEADSDRRTRIKESLLTNGVVSNQYKLSGGLIVPLYVVVLSIMGAAVGVSRRLPEIQRQAAHSVQRSGHGIAAIVARERVVFQIMQVLAAPLIAVTAFATFEPDTGTSAVLIGFTAGFASEAVLTKLRQASEALAREHSQAR